LLDDGILSDDDLAQLGQDALAYGTHALGERDIARHGRAGRASVD
jgi:hypothetical protein